MIAHFKAVYNALTHTIALLRCVQRKDILGQNSLDELELLFPLRENKVRLGEEHDDEFTSHGSYALPPHIWTTSREEGHLNFDVLTVPPQSSLYLH